MDDHFFNFLPKSYAWVVTAFFIILCTLIIAYIERRIFKKLHPKLLRTQKFYDDAILDALHLPLQCLIWLVGLTFAAEVSGRLTQNPLIESMVKPVRDIGIILLFVWFLIRGIKRLERNLLKLSRGKRKLDDTSLHAVSQMLRVAVIITVALILLQTLGIPISGVIAFGGVGGIAVGFAAKDLLANFFGGLMVVLDRPFKVGDWVRSPDKEVEGVVEKIGWRLTRIRSFEKVPVFVPNSFFSTISIQNPSRMLNRRIKTTVGIRYEDAAKIKDIVKDVESMLKNHPEIDLKRAFFVNLINFGPSSLEFLIYTFTKTTEWLNFQEVKQDIFLKVIDIIHKHGAQFAYPTTTLHVPNNVTLKKEFE